MKREEQIKRITNTLWHYPDPREFNNYNLVEALVREAFDNIPIEPTDLISRQDALEQIAQAECGLHYEDCEADNCACDYIWRICNIPSAEPKTGEWIMQNEELKISDYRCSVCGHYQDDVSNYCPNCGANMGGDTE